MKAKESAKNASSDRKSLERYTEAFRNAFEGTNFDFEVKYESETGPAKIKVDDTIYRVDSEEDIKRHCKELLSFDDSAVLVPLDLWLYTIDELCPEIHTDTNFFAMFFSKLEGPEVAMANLAFTASRIGEPTEAFWYSIYNLDCNTLYPKAVVAAVNAYENINEMVQVLSNHFFNHGEEHLNEMPGGFYTSVTLNNGTDDEEHFAVYTTDRTDWDL